MNNTQPIKTGLLAFGMSGRIFHAPFLKVHKGFELTGVVERTNKKAVEYYPDIRSYSSVEEILQDPEIELVIINTPNFTHFDFALKAIRAGKHVLVEKPFSVTSGEAKQLFAEGEKKKVAVLPYHNRRYDSDFSSVKKIIEAGWLGKITEVHFRFDRYATSIGPKKGKETPVPGSGFAYDLGAHLLDGLISLFGAPSSFTKTLGHFRENTLVDDYVHFHLSYPNEMQAFATASVLVPDAQPAFILHGTKGSYIKKRSDIQESQLDQGMLPDHPAYGIEQEGMEGFLTFYDDENRKIQQKIPAERTSYLTLFGEVYQTIRNNKKYPITQEQILTQLQILEQ